MTRKLYYLSFLFVITINLYGNPKILKIVMTKKNPTEYVFNISRDKLHKTILSNKYSLSEGYIWGINDKLMICDSIIWKLLSSPNNSFDLYIANFTYKNKSKTYLKSNGDSIPYWANYYLHFEEIETNKTKVSIFTFDPKIIIGEDWLPSPPHFVRMDKTRRIEPTSIEEYELLLKIGLLIDEKNMPAIILPDSLCKVEIFKKLKKIK